MVPDQHGKVVLFAFRDDEGEAISRRVTQLLRAHGFMVITGVRRVDTAEQYRDMATHLGLVAYVDGDVRGPDSNTRVSVRIRSGYTGRALSQSAFVDARPEIPRTPGQHRWPKAGRTFAPPGTARAHVEGPRRKRPLELTPERRAEAKKCHAPTFADDG